MLVLLYNLVIINNDFHLSGNDSSIKFKLYQCSSIVDRLDSTLNHIPTKRDDNLIINTLTNS